MSGVYHLGISVEPGARGGVVFDKAGGFLGLAVNGKNADRLVLFSELRRIGAPADTAPAAAAAAGAGSSEEVYERALRTVLQVFARPK